MSSGNTACRQKTSTKVFLAIFSAIARNFNAKFYTLITCLYLHYSATGHVISFNCDQVINFFLWPHRYFLRSHAAKCVKNKRGTMFALQTHIVIRTASETTCQWLWELEVSTASFHTCNWSFSEVFSSLVDGKLSQITRSTSLSSATDFCFGEKSSIYTIKNLMRKPYAVCLWNLRDFDVTNNKMGPVVFNTRNSLHTKFSNVQNHDVVSPKKSNFATVRECQILFRLLMQAWTRNKCVKFRVKILRGCWEISN